MRHLPVANALRLQVSQFLWGCTKDIIKKLLSQVFSDIMDTNLLFSFLHWQPRQRLGSQGQLV